MLLCRWLSASTLLSLFLATSALGATVYRQPADTMTVGSWGAAGARLPGWGGGVSYGYSTETYGVGQPRPRHDCSSGVVYGRLICPPGMPPFGQPFEAQMSSVAHDYVAGGVRIDLCSTGVERCRPGDGLALDMAAYTAHSLTPTRSLGPGYVCIGSTDGVCSLR